MNHWVSGLRKNKFVCMCVLPQFGKPSTWGENWHHTGLKETPFINCDEMYSIKLIPRNLWSTVQFWTFTFLSSVYQAICFQIVAKYSWKLTLHKSHVLSSFVQMLTTVPQTLVKMVDSAMMEITHTFVLASPASVERTVKVVRMKNVIQGNYFRRVAPSSSKGVIILLW